MRTVAPTFALLTLLAACHGQHRAPVAPPPPDFWTQEPTPVATETPLSEGEHRLLPVDAVFFQFASHELTPDGKLTLRAVADWMAEVPEAVVIIEGYADRSGPSSYNLWLSHRRADAVARHLEELGVPISRMEIYALGETGAEAGDRAADRRVRVYATAPQLLASR